MCGLCYEDHYLEYMYSHEPAEVQEIRLRMHAFRIWDEQPTPVPAFEKAGDADTLENRIRYMARPKFWYGMLNFRKSIGDMNSSGATLRELTDAVGQDAANQYIEEHRR